RQREQERDEQRERAPPRRPQVDAERRPQVEHFHEAVAGREVRLQQRQDRHDGQHQEEAEEPQRREFPPHRQERDGERQPQKRPDGDAQPQQEVVPRPGVDEEVPYAAAGAGQRVAAQERDDRERGVQRRQQEVPQLSAPQARQRDVRDRQRRDDRQAQFP